MERTHEFTCFPDRKFGLTQKAVLCVNCEIITEGLNGRCDVCGGEALLRLKGILDETADSSQFSVVPSLQEDETMAFSGLVEKAAS